MAEEESYEDPPNLYYSIHGTRSSQDEPGNKWKRNGFGSGASTGLVTGKFSKEETEAIKRAVEEYCAAKGINAAVLCSECDHKSATKGAWTEIAKVLPHRSVQSVYRHGLRQLHPYKRGAWTDDEVEQLMNMVSVHGKKWASIGHKINRSADSCRDKHREMDDSYVRGRWKEGEIEQLKELLRDHLNADENADIQELSRMVQEEGIKIAWSAISKRMGQRSRLSCFKKWQKMTGQYSSSDQVLGATTTEPQQQQQAEVRATKTEKMEADDNQSNQVGTHAAPTSGAAAMAVGVSNPMGSTAEADLDLILLADLVTCDVRRGADVEWDNLRVENAQERWYELMEEFQASAADDSLLAMGLSEIAQHMLDQKTSAQRAAETVEAVDLPAPESLQARDA